MPYAYSEDDAFYIGDDGDDDWEDVPTGIHTFPPGEESVLQSHAGGEAVFHQIMEGIRPGRGDPRTRSHRVQKQVDSWNACMPSLVDAYLQYKNLGPVSTLGEWPLNVVGFEESGRRLFTHSADAHNSNVTLIRYGYIGGSPDKPAIAFAIRTFEIYRQIHRICPRYTMDSLAKTLSHLHKVPRKAYLAEQLTTAYDAYLEILRRVEVCVQAALGRDKSWRTTGICPPCFYRVDGEVKLKFSSLMSLDGNNSLKLVDSTFRAGHPRFDDRKSTSFRWLTPTEVDKYQDEVKNAPKGPADIPEDDTPDSDIAWLNVNELNPDDVNELEKCVDTCVERWKAAGPEARKKMFALFAVAGIFISVCRHGHVLLLCDMIRSGELLAFPFVSPQHLD
ncbi:hypothetical protein B0H11DRAFT_2327591 [Mycena galericulata]|nr:hypothetical protein B0H11DRAFT_2327591 [Mycena galericulata]